MLSLIDKLKYALAVVMLISPPMNGWGQDTPAAVDWDAEWIRILSTREMDETGKLLELTELLLQWGAASGWSSGENWDRTAELLGEWEASPDIETARTAYLRILDTIGWKTWDSGPIQSHEPELREFYQRGLRITTDPGEEANLLFHLAASLYRSEPDSLENRRRIEAFLEQASLAAGTRPQAGHIHYFLGRIYREWGRSGDVNGRGEGSYSSEALYHLQIALSIPEIDPGISQLAQATMESLLISGLELSVGNRYHPEDDIRVTVKSRNIAELEVELFPLPWLKDGLPAGLHPFGLPMNPDVTADAQPVMNRTIRVDTDNRVDWHDSEIMLGGGVQSGWYLLSVGGAGHRKQSLLLVTGIEAVALPREDNSLTLWVVDAETGGPIENAGYFVLDGRGDILFSGTTASGGMAEVVAGMDTSWTEIHVLHDGDPAVIRKSDMEQDSEVLPWIIPDAVSVFPGDRLSWMVVNASGQLAESALESLVVLPEGAGLVPQRDDASPDRGFYVQIPSQVEEYGPVYLALPTGENVLLSHLSRSTLLPLGIELSGEQFASGRSLYVSSTPVGARIYLNEPQEYTGSGYIRVLVEALARPAAFTGQWDPDSVVQEVVYEQITRFGDADLREAYLELPEVAQMDRPVPLRIRIYPLDANTLIGEAYLAVIPYRARVSITASEKIIRTGQAVDIRIGQVQRGLSLPRTPVGDLVAYRENWENRYVHRKKGTLLSEEEYNALPDRSLLGTAKTDYRMLEVEKVREEVLRRRITPVEKTSIPITFERHGYYRIEFQGTDDVRSEYPDGELEVWVLPESGDLDAFRSEDPRLIVEDTPSGEKEILVLVDRTDASILLDLRGMDGQSQARVINPDSSGYYMTLSGGDVALDSCMAIVTGERSTDFLCWHFFAESPAVWDVWMDQVNGLNPGSEFTWKVAPLSGDRETTPVWAIYPEADGELAENSLLLQQLGHSGKRSECLGEAVALTNWLPLFQPMTSSLPESRQQAVAGSSLSDLNLLAALYPETQETSSRKGGFVKFEDFTVDQNEPAFRLSGTLPVTAGRWSLTSFIPVDAQQINSRSWLFSTELPIRTALAGPPVLRSGDLALATLTAENTMRRSTSAEVYSRGEGSVGTPDGESLRIDLPSGSAIDLPVVLNAGGPGQGRLSVSVNDAQMSSTAFLDTVVHATSPQPAVKGFLARAGFSTWEKTVDLNDWDSRNLLISSGIGDHLGLLWPTLRDQYLVHEPLLAALTDWAMEKVKHHHGLGGAESSQKAQSLRTALSASAARGGLAWTQGNDADPWLTALASWAIDTFSSLSEEQLDEAGKQLRDDVESILINESNPVESRIFALRTLAARAIHDPRMRPSRIQAKSFLEFFHNRDQLTVGQAAMLMEVARAYRFNEEVRLLAGYLQDRLESSDTIGALSLWEVSMVHLAMSQVPNTSGLSDQLLEALFSRAESMATHTGWEQIGGFLNLLAVFLWEGDFSVDGMVEVELPGSDPIQIPLTPLDANRGQLLLRDDRIPLENGVLNIKLDTSMSNQAVVVSLVGTRDSPLDMPDYSGQRVEFSREFVEHTLLAGSHVHSVAASLDDSFHPDDTLLMKVSIDVEQSQSHAEFTFMVPAGASLPGEQIKHSVAASSTEGILNNPVFTVRPKDNPIEQKVRLEPLTQGTHEFLLPYHLDWSGTYEFPAHSVRFPKSGQSYRIGPDSRIVIQPPGNQAAFLKQAAD